MDLSTDIITLETAFETLHIEPNKGNLDSLTNNICKYLSLNSFKPYQSIFDQQNSLDIKEYVASSILRIFDKCSTILWSDKDLRLKVFSLLDDVYAETLYKPLKISISDDNHKKSPILQSLLTNSLNDFSKILESIVSLETALSARKRYMAAINKQLNSLFITHHIYDHSLISKERLSEFFNSLESYIKADRMEKLTTYNHIEEIYNCYNKDISRHYKNQFLSTMINDFISKIFKLVKSDFDKSDLHQPSNIELNKINRKYPLDIEGRQFNIKLELENKGPGIALNTNINILEYEENLEIIIEEISTGTIDVGKYDILINAKVLKTSTVPLSILGTISYSDYKNDVTEVDFEIDIIPQNGTVNWDAIRYLQPYSLESVDSETDLIGRKDLLENIYSKLTLKKGESSIIHGQKRVGKTSLAKTIQSRLKKNENCISIFIETGSLDKSSPEKFIKTLGEKVVKKLKHQINTANIEAPKFEGSLQPLVSFIEDIIDTNEKIRIIIIIDEFDEIPSQLYPYSDSGDSFFHNLRSISGESGDGRVSLILIGSENIDTIMQDTDKLNKFDAFNIGYFNKSEYWSDFKELLTSPVKDKIEFTEDAILTLYEITEGNPFYTKFIAKNLYKKMCENRCSFITPDEMSNAINETIHNLEAINVNHFWSDGIRVDNAEKKDLIETQRRKLLISFSEKLRKDEPIKRSDLINDPSLSDIPVKEILENFISRKIIIEDNLKLRIKPRLFEKWLVEKGVNILRSSFSDEDAIQAFNLKEDKIYITDSEIITLCNSWETYRGSEVTTTNIRAWLDQFDNNTEKKRAFKLLQNLNFYGEVKTREKLSIIHNLVTKEIIHYHKKGERVRKDILVSCFGADSKSGPSYLRMYVSENNLTTHSVKKIHEISKSIQQDDTIKAIVFIDDIIATGNTMIENITQLNESCGDILREKNILIIIGVISGLTKAIENVENLILKVNLNIKLKVCDIISEEDKVFSDSNDFFESPQERENTLTLARKYGSKLQSRHPLGYNNSQLLVVFKDNCPNNTLPILWASSNKPKWTPLFKRG